MASGDATADKRSLQRNRRLNLLVPHYTTLHIKNVAIIEESTQDDTRHQLAIRIHKLSSESKLTKLGSCDRGQFSTCDPRHQMHFHRASVGTGMKAWCSLQTNLYGGSFPTRIVNSDSTVLTFTKATRPDYT
jgi:hypothetical protein